METGRLVSVTERFMKALCADIRDRSVGSPGNRKATRLFRDIVASHGWRTEVSELDVIDWEEHGAELTIGERTFPVLPSPYSPGCSAKAPLVSAASFQELQELDMTGSILLLHGDIAAEQLMPKNFVFDNPEEHRRIVALLEERKPVAIVTATGRNASLAGGVYPFPMIEDGDFDIPSVYTTEETGRLLLPLTGRTVHLESRSERIPAKACNVVARKGRDMSRRVVVTAHIDSKKGTPGAIDNATGVTILMILAGLLEDYRGDCVIELAAFNGEDYYAVPGQMDYLRRNQGLFGNIMLNINIDGAGYKEGVTSFSFFGVPEPVRNTCEELFREHPGISEGVQWVQGDHSIFVQQGCPAIAVSSRWFIDNIDSQEITHTPKDDLDIVDFSIVADAAMALEHLIRRHFA